jgi:hypothetical protein
MTQTKVSPTAEQVEAHYRLQEIIEQLSDLGNEAAGIMREFFPSSYMSGEAYGAFNLGSSCNRYDTTLRSLVEDIDPYEKDEEEPEFD